MGYTWPPLSLQDTYEKIFIFLRLYNLQIFFDFAQTNLIFPVSKRRDPDFSGNVRLAHQLLTERCRMC